MNYRSFLTSAYLLGVALAGFGPVTLGQAPAWNDSQVSSAPAFSPPTPAQVSHHVVLLLRNGHVIEGTLITQEPIYRIKVPDGEIFLSKRDVLAVAGSLYELYQQQKMRLFSRDAEFHFQLAIWCAEHGLENEALAELAEARAINPNHPGLALAVRRVEMALSRTRGQAGDVRVKSGEAATASREEMGLRALPEGPTRYTTGTALAEAGRPAPPFTRDPRLLMRGLPEEAREDFVRVIQPIVSHNCASASCHGGPGVPPSARLLRLAGDQHASRGQVAQNLQTILGWIDFNNPGASPLLAKPLQPHGGLPGPIFSGTDMKQYRDLVDWVYRITRQRTPPQPEELTQGLADQPLTASSEGLTGIDLNSVLPSNGEGVRAAGFESPSESDQPVQAAAALESEGPSVKTAVLYEGRAPQDRSGLGQGSARSWTSPVRIPVGEFLQLQREPAAEIRFGGQ